MELNQNQIESLAWAVYQDMEAEMEEGKNERTDNG